MPGKSAPPVHDDGDVGLDANDEDVVEAAGAVAVTKCNEVAFKCRNRQFIVDENKTYKNLPHVGHC